MARRGITDCIEGQAAEDRARLARLGLFGRARRHVVPAALMVSVVAHMAAPDGGRALRVLSALMFATPSGVTVTWNKKWSR